MPVGGWSQSERLGFLMDDLFVLGMPKIHTSNLAG